MIRILTIILILIAAPVFGADYYMTAGGTAAWNATTGCATANGMSKATHNAATIPAGSNVYICDTGGDYVGSPRLTINDDGESGNETSYLPAPGDSPVFDGNNAISNAIIIEADYIILGDLTGNTITAHDTTSGGIAISSADVAVTNVTIQNCTTYNAGTSGIAVYQDSDYYANTDHTIRNNTSYNNQQAGISVVGYGGVSDILISKNLTYSNNQSGGAYNQISIWTNNTQITAAAQHSGNVYYNTTPAAITTTPDRVIQWGDTDSDERELTYTDTSGTWANLTDGQYDYDPVGDRVYANVGGALSVVVRVYYGSIDAVTIEYNESRNCVATTTTNSDGDGIYADIAVSDVVIRYNYVHDNAGNGISLNLVDGSSVYGNLIVDNATASSMSAGVHYRKQMIGTNALYNNTIVNNGNYGVRFPTYNGGTVLIKNNIIKDHDIYGISLDNAGEWTVTEDYNDNHNNGTRDQNVTDGANTIAADPLFVDAVSDQYWVQSSSPTIGAHTSLGSPYYQLESESAWPASVSVSVQNAIGAYQYPITGNIIWPRDGVVWIILN